MIVEPGGRARFLRETKILARRDRVLREVIRGVGPCTLGRRRDHFLALSEAILWQQLSWKAANAIHANLLGALGRARPRPSDLLRTPEAAFAEAGVSRQKTRYLRGLARYFEEKRFPSRWIAGASDEEIVCLLSKLEGIGRWTVEMYLIFGLNRLDVFPAGDLGLKKSIGRRYGFDGIREPDRIGEVTDRWRPYRTVGTWYMWKSADGTPLDAARVSGERAVSGGSR
jgi:DNA-3-methyladenine glycosylase II